MPGQHEYQATRTSSRGARKTRPPIVVVRGYTSTSHNSQQLQDTVPRSEGAVQTPEYSRRDSELKELTAFVSVLYFERVQLEEVNQE